jgi:hypothetical protein
VKTIEIRRHACTKKGIGRGKGSQLSQSGVLLAREISIGQANPDYVLTTTVPRTLETALAMGFAVDRCLEIPRKVAGPAMAIVGHLERWSWPEPWRRFRELARDHEEVARFGAWLRERWQEALAMVPEGGHVLVISHGRDIELGVLACLPDLGDDVLAALGEPLHQCEGATLDWDGARFELRGVHRTRRCQPDRN